MSFHDSISIYDWRMTRLVAIKNGIILQDSVQNNGRNLSLQRPWMRGYSKLALAKVERL